MATNTPKLTLVKPTKPEKYSLDILNSNSDKIDLYATNTDNTLTTKANKTQESWITATLLNGATTDVSNPLRYRKNQFDVVEFVGVVTPTVSGQPFILPPVGYRPITAKCRIPVVSTDDVIGRINISGSGFFQLSTLTNKEINMTGVSYPTL
jgi:hypothetical protein